MTYPHIGRRPPEHAPGELNELRATTYPMEYKCANCGRSAVQQIPKGTPAPKMIDKPCPNCGCRELVKG